MGREARVKKVRVIKSSGDTIYADSQEVKEDAELARRLDRMGLISPRLILREGQGGKG